MSKRVDHHFLLSGQPAPPLDDALLFDYLVGSNGTLIRARTDLMEVGLPAANFRPLRRLDPVTPFVNWRLPKVPAPYLERMLALSRGVCVQSPTEALFYLSWDPNPAELDAGAVLGHEGRPGWCLEFPQQRATEKNVEPIKTGIKSATDRAIIEVHSHHEMAAEFSEGDDADELDWFRVYAVLGNIFEQPEVRARVTAYGYVCEWPASTFFELPAGLTDCVKSLI